MGLGAVWWRMGRTARNTFRHFILGQPLRGLSALAVVLVVWLMLGFLFLGVLAYLGQDQFVALKPGLLESLLSLFFFTLFFLVTISGTVLIWGSLFRSRAALFHAQLPLSDRQLFWGGSVEGGLWASWAVLVLCCPLVGALVLDTLAPYGTVRLHLPVGPALVMVALSGTALVAFILCCVATGAVGALLLARFIPLLRRGFKGIILLVLAALMASSVLVLGGLEHRAQPATFMREVTGKLAFAENPYLPPWWTQQALDAALTRRWGEWLYFLGLLLSTASVLAVVGEWLAGRRLRRDLDAVIGRPEPHAARRSRPWRLLPLLSPDLGLLAAKDLRLFLRDPAQVLQFTAFFGLLGFYLLMLPRIGTAFMFDAWWRPAVSLLNLTAVAMALATFTGRFVYPLLSLEGRRLWVLVLAPWPRHRVVTAKFAFALLVGLPASVALVTLSGFMLELPGEVVAYQAVTIACMAVGFSASALGLGARLADYTEDDPAKLVAGYGGTINLMASLLFSGLLLVGAAVPLWVEGLGGWRWPAGLVWTVGITAAWSLFFLRLAWRWFGHLG